MEEIKPQVKAYEWVLIMSKDDAVVLTENQYKIFKDNVKASDMRQMFFPDVSFNPAFVVSSYKRRAEYIRNKYPCKACHQSGRKPDMSWCDSCGGSGVDLQNPREL